MCGACFASVAIRSILGEMAMEFGVSCIVPSSVPQTVAPFPPPVPFGSVPRLRRYNGAIGLLAARLASLRFLRFAIPPARRRRDLPGSWRTLAVRALLYDLGGTRRQAIGHSALPVGAAVLPSASAMTSAPTTARLSRLN